MQILIPAAFLILACFHSVTCGPKIHLLSKKGHLKSSNVDFNQEKLLAQMNTSQRKPATIYVVNSEDFEAASDRADLAFHLSIFQAIEDENRLLNLVYFENAQPAAAAEMLQWIAYKLGISNLPDAVVVFDQRMQHEFSRRDFGSTAASITIGNAVKQLVGDIISD